MTSMYVVVLKSKAMQYASNVSKGKDLKEGIAVIKLPDAPKANKFIKAQNAIFKNRIFVEEREENTIGLYTNKLTKEAEMYTTIEKAKAAIELKRKFKSYKNVENEFMILNEAIIKNKKSETDEKGKQVIHILEKNIKNVDILQSNVIKGDTKTMKIEDEGTFPESNNRINTDTNSYHFNLFIKKAATKANMQEATHVAYIDGSYKESESIPAGTYGVVVYEGEKKVFKKSGFVLGDYFEQQKSNGAEYAGLVQALEWGVSNEVKSMKVYYDYEGILINLLKKENNLYQTIVKNLLRLIDVEFNYVEKDTIHEVFHHEAHTLANLLR